MAQTRPRAGEGVRVAKVGLMQVNVGDCGRVSRGLAGTFAVDVDTGVLGGKGA